MTTYPLAFSTWGDEEIEAIQSVIATDMYTMGKHVKQFEEEFAEYFGSPHAVMVNSGSSANLLMLSLLKWKYKLTGDIIVPVVGWATTYFPVVQNGFRLKFVDVDPNTWNLDVEKLRDAIDGNTCAIMAVNLLGNSCNYAKIKQLCEQHDLKLIEDNCESMGAKYHNNYTGTIGLAGSFSFFFSHHIQTMEGGMVLCQNKDDAEYMRSLRAHGWVRDLPADSPLYKKTGNAFDDNFIFATPGYNVRPLEMSGAIGSVQLKKWPQIEETRVNNAKHFVQLFGNKPFLRIQQIVGKSSWFTFGIVLDGELKGRRAEIVKALDEAGIQNRPLASRNFLKQPVMRELDHIASGEMTAADDIHDNGFFVGNGSKDITEELDKLYTVIHSFCK
tara:strand:+ start:417 stop:1577 length:1161 start_codon:yes stop_codon:yes gene_type:complete